MLTVIERARRYLAKCPVSVSGQHGHDAAFHAAAVLWNGFGLSEGDTLALLREWNAGCQPPWSESELAHKVWSVAGAQHRDRRGHLLGPEGRGQRAEGRNEGKFRRHPGLLRPSRTGAQERVISPPPPAKAVFRPMVLRRVAAKVPGVVDVVAFLKDRSPVDLEAQDSAGVLRWLYPRGCGEKVVIFSSMKSQGQMVWDADRAHAISNRALPAGPDGVWFLPQPVDGGYHANPRLGGKRSRRSEEAVTAWRYLVVESDEAEPDAWLRCLLQLPLRIACICESGRRSIHALVRLDAASKGDWDTKVGVIKPVLVTLGADAGALSAVRLTRLPQARRAERVQRLLYLNPALDGAPILALPSRVRAGASGTCQQVAREEGEHGRPAN